MSTIIQPRRKTSNTFLCLVKRGASDMKYQSHDGSLHPVHPERWEAWKVLADDHKGAMETAKYHFYNSLNTQILITNKPVNA
jgi:hypothetical protein